MSILNVNLKLEGYFQFWKSAKNNPSIHEMFEMSFTFKLKLTLSWDVLVFEKCP